MLRIKALQADASVSVLVQMTDVSDTSPPTAPGDLTANVVGAGRVDLSWTASTDDVGVASYAIYRDGSLLKTVTPRTTYSDTTAGPGTTYRYEVRARDASGNVSAPSNAATATTPGNRLFLDGFETGDLSQWPSGSGVVVQQQHVRSGLFAARATGAGTPAYRRATLSAPQSNLYYRARFKLISQGANTVYLLRLRTAGDASIIGLYVNSTGRLGWRNDVAAVGNTSATVVTQGVWHEVQLRARINGTSGETEVLFDGARVDSLSRTESLGTNAVGRLQLGENLSGVNFDVAFDDIAADTAFIGDDAGPDTSPPDTSILLGPSGSVNDTTAVFTFTATESGSTFACSLDGAPFGPCPFSYSGLAQGPHTFSVRATDAAGNTDPTPAQRTWTVDTIAPAAPAITSPAEGSVLTSDTVTLTGIAEPAADVEILDDGVSLGLGPGEYRGDMDAHPEQRPGRHPRLHRRGAGRRRERIPALGSPDDHHRRRLARHHDPVGPVGDRRQRLGVVQLLLERGRLELQLLARRCGPERLRVAAELQRPRGRRAHLLGAGGGPRGPRRPVARDAQLDRRPHGSADDDRLRSVGHRLDPVGQLRVLLERERVDVHLLVRRGGAGRVLLAEGLQRPRGRPPQLHGRGDGRRGQRRRDPGHAELDHRPHPVLGRLRERRVRGMDHADGR